jgi:hypothetical protein
MSEIFDSILKTGFACGGKKHSFSLFLSVLTGFRPRPSVFRAATHITTPCVHPTDHDIRQRQLPELVLEPLRRPISLASAHLVRVPGDPVEMGGVP